ncbi:tol-pal system YbgF family protein [Luteolibacter sp. Populi]|uniref:tetratricopeptide repeat protein n=1 Tax=Luteolibacter sp. Populi TaxID=3230487 RepID=UPI0034664FB7
MKSKLFPGPRIWLASLCLAAISCSRPPAAEKAPAPPAGEESAPKTEAAAYAEIVALKPRKGNAELVRLAPAFLQTYPDSPHFEEVAGIAGEALMRKEDWKGALDCYLRLAERSPKSADIGRFNFQVAICRLEMKEFEPAALLLEKFLKDYPASGLKEDATYRLAMAYFLNNDYVKTLRECRAYLKAYPEGIYAGDILYRLAFIDANDKEVDQSKNIISFLGDFIEKKPADPAVGAMRCLVADTWLKQKPTKPEDPAAAAKEIRINEDAALEHYRKAALSPTSKSNGSEYVYMASGDLLAELNAAEYAYKAAGDLLAKHGEDNALREFRAEFRKQLEARQRKMEEEEGK